MSNDLKKFIKDRCYDFGALYALEEEFNTIGLTVQQTLGGDMVLCRLIDSMPIAEELGVDHIYVGVRSRPRDEIPHKLLKCVLEFVESAGGVPDKLMDSKCQPRAGHSGFYGTQTDTGPILQDMALSKAEIKDCLLDILQNALSQDS